MKRFCSNILFVFLLGCTEHHELSEEQIVSQHFLENRGYLVVSYEGAAATYELTKQKIIELRYMMQWGLQSVDPSEYIDKTIHVEKFIVQNHPLRNGKVDVFVYVADGLPIGGTSSPHDDVSDGGYWSLDGKTLGELQPLPFQEWRQSWVTKYSG